MSLDMNMVKCPDCEKNLYIPAKWVIARCPHCHNYWSINGDVE